uniref:Uncharacterized protein n=1 Tax=Panagrolaimus sp. JU765 TaxID=591449 RepID=A0AC34PYS0_9BILA
MPGVVAAGGVGVDVFGVVVAIGGLGVTTVGVFGVVVATGGLTVDILAFGAGVVETGGVTVGVFGTAVVATGGVGLTVDILAFGAVAEGGVTEDVGVLGAAVVATGGIGVTVIVDVFEAVVVATGGVGVTVGVLIFGEGVVATGGVTDDVGVSGAGVVATGDGADVDVGVFGADVVAVRIEDFGGVEGADEAPFESTFKLSRPFAPSAELGAPGEVTFSFLKLSRPRNPAEVDGEGPASSPCLAVDLRKPSRPRRFVDCSSGARVGLLLSKSPSGSECSLFCRVRKASFNFVTNPLLVIGAIDGILKILDEPSIKLILTNSLSRLLITGKECG